MSLVLLPAHESSDAGSLEDTAVEAERLARSDPERAAALATEILSASESTTLARCTAERALGLTLRSAAEFDEAGVHFSRAIEMASQSGLEVEAAFGRLLLASIHAIAGRHDDAVALLDSAADQLEGERLVAAIVQRGSVKAAAGDFLGAIDDFHSIGEGARELVPDQRAVLLMNWGSALLATHHPREAASLFQEVIDLRGGIDGGNGRLTGPLLHLARAYAISGSTPEALACFRKLDELSVTTEDVAGLVDRAIVLVAAGLFEEAEAAAERARRLAANDETIWAPLAPLIHSQVLEQLGEFEPAEEAAREAADGFDRRSDEAQGDVARGIAARCAARLGRADFVRMSELAERLSGHGMLLEAMKLRTHIARGLGPVQAARPHLNEIAGVEARGLLDGTLNAEARAALAVLDGEPESMREIVARALDELSDWRVALGSAELSAMAARLAEPLGAMAIADAIDRNDPLAALVAGERLRIASITSGGSVEPDERLDPLLDRLRSLSLGSNHLEQESARSDLEAEVRALARIRGRAAGNAHKIDPDQLLAQHADATLVEFLDHRGTVYAVVFDGDLRMRPVAMIEELRNEIDSIRFAMQRLAAPVGSAASRSAFELVMGEAAGRLSALLVEPLRLPLAQPLVLVPSLSVASMPWSLLDTLAGMDFSVSPAAHLRILRSEPAEPGRRVVIGVEDPPAAIGEAQEISELVGGHLLAGPDATVDSVLHAIDGSEVAHLASHGRFRADNPLMSSVGMADGPLTVYDIERLDRAPGIIVMSACEVGQTMRTPGEGLMGMSASLMAAGTRSVVAASTVVSDAATRPVMVELHRELLRGSSVAASLRRARSIAARDPEMRLAAASFVCLGV